MESRERHGRKDKKKLKNHVFQFCMNMRKIRTDVQNEPDEGFWLQLKERVKTDFARPCEIFAQSCEML